MYGGQTRILVSKILSQQNRKLRPNSSSVHVSTPSSPPATSDESHSPSESVPEVHPSLVEYLSMLPPPATLSVPTMDTMDTADANLQPTFEPTMPMEGPLFTSAHGMPSQASCIPPNIPRSARSGYDQNISMGAPNMAFFDMQPLNGTEDTLSDNGDFEFMLSGESGMNEKWTSFIRESGIFGAI